MQQIIPNNMLKPAFRTFSLEMPATLDLNTIFLGKLMRVIPRRLRTFRSDRRVHLKSRNMPSAFWTSARRPVRMLKTRILNNHAIAHKVLIPPRSEPDSFTDRDNGPVKSCSVGAPLRPISELGDRRLAFASDCPPPAGPCCW